MTTRQMAIDTQAYYLAATRETKLTLSIALNPKNKNDTRMWHYWHCCNVCQALKNSLVLVPELAHLRIFILRYTNVLIVIVIVVTLTRACLSIHYKYPQQGEMPIIS